MRTLEVIKGEALEELKKIEDKSIDLVLIDPPYYKIMTQDHKGKKYDWDNQWETLEDYISWIRRIGLEVNRVLKENGSFYIFADDRICAYLQVELDKIFHLENSITWVKPNNLTIKGWTGYRMYAPITEKILFYSKGEEMTGLEYIEDTFIKPKNPMSAYLREEFKRANITIREIAKLFPSRTGGLTGCVSNWLNGDNFITEEQYNKVRDYLNGEYLRREYEDLRREYEDLRREYEDLRREYEDLRRYFKPKQNFTDVWTFNIIGGKENVKHPTQKPLKIIRRIIETSTKPGMRVLDCFGGSGTTVVACKQLDRECILIEREQEYIDLTNERLSKVNSTLDTFSSP